MTNRLDAATRATFLQGPADRLVEAVVEEINAVPQWRAVIGTAVGYKRMDFPMRELPALRIYSDRFRKNSETGYIDGFLIADLILPASLRREETQNVQDILSAAMLQQFRRPTFFQNVKESVPGLNELGKSFEVDKAMGFDFGREGSDVCPLTQFTFNYRLLLSEWDRFLEFDNRTVDEPFTRTLGDLERLVSVIEALRDSTEVDLVVPLDLKTTE